MSEIRRQYRRVVFIADHCRSHVALLRSVTDERVAVLELLHGPRDGEIVREVRHDPTGTKSNSWHDPAVE